MLSTIFWWYMIVVNVATFFTFVWDKYRAIRSGWRVSEKTLLLLTAVGGWLGAMIAQSVFRHKTTKTSFVWKFWVIIVVWIICTAFVLLKN